MNICDEIEAERFRQVWAEGFLPTRDDKYTGGELAMAAAAYAMSYKATFDGRCPYRALLWPWNVSWWKPTNRRRDLIKAGALIVAEIERLDRLQAPERK